MDNGKEIKGNGLNTAETSASASTPSWVSHIKIITAVTTASCFALGIRAARNQARPMDPKELSRKQIFGGVGFAARTLGIATLITVSAYGLFVVGISSALGVNSPKEFGMAVRRSFGDKYRISNPKTSESYDSLSELFEAANRQTSSKPGGNAK
jgi:hypothetical protein